MAGRDSPTPSAHPSSWAQRGQPELRASLCGAQIIGLVLARHVVGIEPSASATDDQVAAWVGPTLQRHLTAPHPA